MTDGPFFEFLERANSILNFAAGIRQFRKQIQAARAFLGRYWKSISVVLPLIAITILRLCPGFVRLPLNDVSLKPEIASPVSGQIHTEFPLARAVENPKEIINLQAQEMAREFEAVLNTVSTKPMSQRDIEFYEDYLTGTVPAVIASVCGEKEWHEYMRLLQGLEHVKDLQLRYRGVAGFMRRPRTVRPDTPEVGEYFVLKAMSQRPLESNREAKPSQEKDSSAKDHQYQVFIHRANSDPLPNHESEREPIESAKPEVFQNSPIIERPAIESVVKKNVAPSSSPGVPTKLENYLNQMAWVRCRHCGTVHQMPMGYFAEHDHHVCSKCGFIMSTVAFSKGVAKQRDKLAAESSRHY